jgi:adenylate cyclase class 2
MRVEAEIKARLRNPVAVHTRLDALATGVVERYRDRYFDVSGDRELRVRTITTAERERHLLTYKEPPVDVESGSRPEYETEVADPDVMSQILTGLGYRENLAFVKECVNYRIDRDNRRYLATLVTVPEIDGVFLEVETTATESEVEAALAAIRDLLDGLGVGRAEETTDTYTDAVTAVRLGRTGRR